MRRSAGRLLVALFAVGLLIAGCSSGVGGSPDHGPSATPPAGPSASGAGAGDASPSDDGGSAPMRVSFPDLLGDPEQLIGRPIEVMGTAFFLAKCPPPAASPTPGASATASCVVQGYLAAPDRGVLTPSDLPGAIPLAEGGHLLSCDEGTESPPACGDWLAATRYMVVGTVERQVLGGRETALMQLDVLSKTTLP